VERKLTRAEIESQMSAIRGNLDGEVGGIVRNARRLVDWRYYVRSYPWSTLMAATAAGYLLVPRSSPKQLPPPVSNFGSRKEAPQIASAPVEATVAAGLFGSLATMAAKYAVNMAVQYAGQQFRSRWAQNGPLPSARTVEP
jgi:hypothetical protein